VGLCSFRRWPKLHSTPQQRSFQRDNNVWKFAPSVTCQKKNTILNRLTQICGYADDILVITRRLSALEALCVEIRREAGKVGVVINPDKAKYMTFSAYPSRRSVKEATINGVTYEGVAEFIYWGYANQ